MVKEAYRFAIPPLVVGAACLAAGWKWPAAVLVFLGLFVFYFFRDPNRAIPSAPDTVVSPADGHVVEIVDEMFESTMGHRVTIFLAIWDVHVQRAPVAGRIANVVYRPGKFYAAFRSAASVENEQNVIYIDTPQGTLVFKQIAGAIARRVICWKRKGEIVALGERVGLIRFGSRVDIWLPMAAEVVVKRGQKVEGGRKRPGEMEFNSIDPIGHEEEPRRLFRNHRLRRGIYILPSMFTVANLLCGYYAILAVFEGKPEFFDRAACAIGFAILFDSLDGRVARAMGTNSEFGKQFDSLADVVSFGMAPAFLAYAWGVRTLAAADAPDTLHLTQLGWLIGSFYLGCCAWRLARFNIQGMAPGGNRFFAGMPTPAAAGMIAAVVHCFKNPIQDEHVSLMWLALVIVLGLLMSSTVRYYSFKDFQWTRRMPSLAIILLVLLIGSVVLFSQITLMLIASTYVIQGVTLFVVRSVRHRIASRPA